MKTILTIGAMLAAGLLSGAAMPAVISAQAQDAPRIEIVPSYSESEIKSFAVAALEVRRINDAYLPRLGAAKTPEEEQVVLDQAAGEMTQAIEQNGMSLQRFTQILKHAQANDGLAERVRQHMQQAQ